ncbi:hypothetical protein BO83DRAFT_379097 [Aspergillus eucalypticola CBS 122712]|uniref:Uncharacterized protein n=1 Tax=Aspergillus eucalypticola (strain CBS 122712 / IBT 29274) TaxID=1448314 RepID=A0A317VCL1_ASPEC|nr:uncharacterized protein BO83DRAFT_379097 [Aspergillus eucalypticola CBS 122712]PWY72104.1 hypothetical protein BO83DRAFT_379097 [Aspergillus eucalypticola CBS 122712]
MHPFSLLLLILWAHIGSILGVRAQLPSDPSPTVIQTHDDIHVRAELLSLYYFSNHFHTVEDSFPYFGKKCRCSVQTALETWRDAHESLATIELSCHWRQLSCHSMGSFQRTLSIDIPLKGIVHCWPLVVIFILRVVCAISKMVVLLMEVGVTRSLVHMSMAINSWLRHQFSRCSHGTLSKEANSPTKAFNEPCFPPKHRLFTVMTDFAH